MIHFLFQTSQKFLCNVGIIFSAFFADKEAHTHAHALINFKILCCNVVGDLNKINKFCVCVFLLNSI